MAILSRDILKGYFKTGAYPTEEQFASLIDSMLHQTDKVTWENIEGLSAVLNDKASYSSVAELYRILRLKELVSFYIDDFGGFGGFSMSMANWAVNCYLNEQDTRGITMADANLLSSIFLDGTGRYYERLMTASVTNSNVSLRPGVNWLGYIDGKGLSLRAELATGLQPGLMSAEDKAKLDAMSGSSSSGCSFAEAVAALPTGGGAIRMGNNFMKFNEYNEVSWGVLKSLLLNTSTEGSVHQIENNHYTNMDTNYQYNEVYSDDEEFSLSETAFGQNDYAFVCCGDNIIISSGHELYALSLRMRYLGGPTETVTLTITDEDNVQSTTVILSDTTNFVECVLDYGNTPLTSLKKVYITGDSEQLLNIMMQVTLKFLPI